MRKNLLLPHGLKKIGWILLTPSLILGVAIASGLLNLDKLAKSLGFENKTKGLDFTTPFERGVDTIAILGIVIGVLFVACSREKIEDELTSHIRLDALMLAFYIYFGMVVLITLFVYEIDYILYMTYSVLGFMVLFLAIFRIKLWRLRKEGSNEE
jgi:hypothetical protein